ncbi:hypothetical protein PSTG_01718 [Puccinia striiformis f. sp. tritici PST-78]|uniref:Uncharacterized protein n=1 Tax=Puccinia striiformis f. sp. tritici PST-78 TaxID=1165861 RepID=A0A0L0W0P7_9BASI|nr:hypothetical protein PSTG_01718 [Puccinia striiformis f. sp. tritici PST-78]
MDTERLKISDLLQGYMEWAKEDSILKSNSYVFGGSNVKDSETYTKLVEGYAKQNLMALEEHFVHNQEHLEETDQTRMQENTCK